MISLKRPLFYLFITLLSVGSLSCQDQPLSQFQKAKFAVELAAGSGAIRYAEPFYRDAEELLKRGQIEIARQNSKFAPFRDYQKAKSILLAAYNKANEAAESTKSRIDWLKSKAQAESKSLREELMTYREALDGSLLLIHAESQWSAAELALNTSERLILNEEYEDATKAAYNGRYSLHRLNMILTDYSNDIANKMKLWRRWVNETIEDSRADGSSAIIVDKSDHRLYLIQAGRLTKTYECELGYNSAVQKFFSGDGATPEGKYRITKYRPNGSAFHKALMINYPNDEDRKRFAENKSKGIISRNARIGALIEIHGEGGKSEDWTNGCVALKNGDIDHLMQFVSVGTPVTIVRKSDRWP
jgi:L,D-peptidoglycan transpeptidase YkuD (ErfK/YbiS/YcfS/YnhG family)